MNNKIFYTLLAILLAASALFWIYMFRGTTKPAADNETAERSEYESDITLPCTTVKVVNAA